MYKRQIPLCRKPIQYFENTEKSNSQCNDNSIVKADIAHERYDSKQMMKDIKSIQLYDCKEIEDKVELYKKFKQIIDKHRERTISDFENPQVIKNSTVVTTSGKINDVFNGNNSGNNHTELTKTAGINKINCTKCNASTTSVAVQTNNGLVNERVEDNLSQNVPKMDISKSITTNNLKRGSLLKSQISSPTDITIKNSFFTSSTIPIISKMSFNTDFIGKKLQNTEAECKAESKSKLMDNQIHLTKPVSSKPRRQSTSRFQKSHPKGVPICFPIYNTNKSLKTSSVFYVSSKENNIIAHCIIENLLFEISENLIKKLDKKQFQNHLDPLLKASTDYNFHSKLLNNHFSQSVILDELITKYIEDFNTLKIENLFKLIILLLDSVCEMLYNYFENPDCSSVRWP